VVIRSFKLSSTSTQSVNTVRRTSGFWRKHKSARVRALCNVHVCYAGNRHLNTSSCLHELSASILLMLVVFVTLSKFRLS